MTHKEFSALLKRRIKLTQDTLDRKSKEYSTGADRLHNFKRAAEMNQTTPEKVLHGMLTKHLISYMDMLESDKEYSREYIDEKFGDVINYFILCEAIFVERRLKTEVKL